MELTVSTTAFIEQVLDNHHHSWNMSFDRHVAQESDLMDFLGFLKARDVFWRDLGAWAQANGIEDLDLGEVREALPNLPCEAPPDLASYLASLALEDEFVATILRGFKIETSWKDSVVGAFAAETPTQTAHSLEVVIGQSGVVKEQLREAVLNQLTGELTPAMVVGALAGLSMLARLEPDLGDPGPVPVYKGVSP